MFSSGPNYNKLKTNLRLSSQRLKLLEKKKTETNQKARKEIADFISIGKPDRARIRVESIIREDYLIEAMEILEMFCDLLLARFGLIQQLKELDEGISEAVSSIIWIAPRLADIAELKIISDILTAKYGKPFADSCRAAVHPANVSEKLQHKMSIQAPPKLLVEKYLIEISKMYNIDYEPDQSIMQSESRSEGGGGGFLIDFNEKNNLSGGGSSGGGQSIPPALGFVAYPQPPPFPVLPQNPGYTAQPFNYPPSQPPFPGQSSSQNIPSAPVHYNIQPSNSNDQPPPNHKETKDLNVDFLNNEKGDPKGLPPPYSSLSPDDNIQNSLKPKPNPRSKLPDLPNVPSNNLAPLDDDEKKDDDEIDFDDLSRRFEELKKRH